MRRPVFHRELTFLSGHYNLPNPLVTYLYASHPQVIRDLQTLSITLGPYDSFYAHDKTSAQWANLPPLLEKAVLNRLESQDPWKTVWKEGGQEAPSFVSLGADGTYFMRTVCGGGSWDLKITPKTESDGMKGTNSFLEEAKDFKGVAVSLIICVPLKLHRCRMLIWIGSLSISPSSTVIRTSSYFRKGVLQSSRVHMV